MEPSNNKFPGVDRRLTDLRNALYVTTDDLIAVRTGINGNIVIEGNVTIPGTITVESTPENPVHTHITEVGTSGILDVPYLPIGGSVKLTDGTHTIGFELNNNDGELPNTYSVPTESYTMVFNGSTWDRLRGDTTSGAWVNIKNSSLAVTGTFWQATQPVSIATMPTTPVTGTFWQATQPVSIATMPTTPVTQSTIPWQISKDTNANATNNPIYTNVTNFPAYPTSIAVTQSTIPWQISKDTNPNASGNPIYTQFTNTTIGLSAGSASIGTVGLNSGSNTIGKVDQGTGGSSAWKVDIGTNGSVTLLTGSATIGNVGLNAGTNYVGKFRITDGTNDISLNQPADAIAAPYSVPTEDFNMVYNGSSWDRLRGSSTQGAWVTVKNSYLPISKDTNANASGNPIYTSITNFSDLSSIQVTNNGTFRVQAEQYNSTPWKISIVDSGGNYNDSTHPVYVNLTNTEVEIKNDLNNPLPISKDTNANSSSNPIYTSGTITGGVVVSNLPDASVTAFEEPLAVGITPQLQGDTVYGLDSDFWRTTELRGGTVITTNTSLFQVQSGTSAGGYARLATSRYVRYQPGQGLMYRWTAAFTNITNAFSGTKNASGVTNILQNTGPIDRESGYSIGYSGQTGTDSRNADRSKIGILHRRAGLLETQVLTLSAYNTGAQTAIVTLNSVPYTISLSTSTSIPYCAQQIKQKLQAISTVKNLWDIDACGNTVTFNYYSPGPQAGTYTFSSSGTGTPAAGLFSQIQAGASPVDDWYYIDSWNGTVPASFDPAKLNVYGMDLRWLGAGRVRFFMEDPATGKMVLIHTQVWTKDQTGLYPHVRNPSMRITYRAGTTNTSVTPSQNVIVSGASVFGAVQGTINQTGSSQSFFNLDGSSRNKDIVWHLLSIQNPFLRNNLVNKSSLVIQDISISLKSTDPAVLYLVKNSVGTSDLLVFGPLPNASSTYFTQYSTSAVTENLALDAISLVQTVNANGSAQFNLLPYNFVLAPGEYMSVFISSTQSFNSSSIGMTWKVD